ncbi:MAG: VWA domain-containing protein [Thiolinea sp.]
MDVIVISTNDAFIVGNRFFMMRLFHVFVVFVTLLSPLALSAEESENAVIVFDASGSMWGRVEGDKPKIQVAREVMGNVLDGWVENINLGIIAYGHREKGNCNDIEVIAPIDSFDKDSLLKKINALNPKGKTPISASLQKAADELRYKEEVATIILISDGEETCSADPCVVAKQLEEEGINFTTHVIGFDIENNDQAASQLKCIAENTGGQFHRAEDAGELKVAIEEAAKKLEEEANNRKEEAKRKAEEEAKRKAEEEAKRKAEEEAKRKAEEEAKRKAEEEAKRKAEEEAKRKAEEEAKRKAEEEAKKEACRRDLKTDEKEYSDGRGGAVYFPHGDQSFVDEVVSFSKGEPGAEEKESDPEAVLGAPDHAGKTGYLTLGCEGTVTFAFKDNALIDIEGYDLHVFEVGPDVEPTRLEISKNGEEWVDIGKISGGKAEIDINEYVEPDDVFKFVRLTDLKSRCGGRTPGADIDAIGAIGSCLIGGKSVEKDNAVVIREDSESEKPDRCNEFSSDCNQCNKQEGCGYCFETQTCMNAESANQCTGLFSDDRLTCKECIVDTCRDCVRLAHCGWNENEKKCLNHFLYEKAGLLTGIGSVKKCK